MHRSHAITKNISWLVGDKLIRLTLGLFVSGLLARVLGPEMFGRLNFAVALIAIFIPIATFGSEGIIVRELVRAKLSMNAVLGSAFYLRLALGFIAFILCNLLVLFVSEPNQEIYALTLIIGSSLVFQAFDIFDCFFQSRVMSKYTVIARGIGFFIASIIRIVILLTYPDIFLISITYLIEVVLSAVIQLYFGAVEGVFVSKLQPKLKEVGLILLDSWPLAISGLSIMMYMRIDQIMIASMVGEEQLGQYSAALRFSETLYFLPSIFLVSFMPKIQMAFERSKKEYFHLLQKFFNWIVLAAYIVSISLTLVSSQLIHIVFGAGYEQAAAILSVHVWTLVFVYLGVAQNAWIIPNNKTKFALIETIVAAVSNVVLNLYLIPKYQALGAAIATLVSQFLASYITWAYNKETRKIMGLMTKSLILNWSLGNEKN